jgi:predicted dehydrogenase
MKALVLGCGSIGIRHIGHLLQLGVTDVQGADPDSDKCRQAKDKFGIVMSTSPEEALQSAPDIVLVCTPAQTHVPMALKALEAGAHVFIEKPLSTGIAGTEILVQAAQKCGKTVQVGYNLRFHPAMRTMKKMSESGQLGKVLMAHAEFGLYLSDWWPGRDYRNSYMAHTDMSGGLLMDASHEIDLLLWYLGGVQKVAAFGGQLSNLEIDSADAIKVILKMKSGAVASLHLDCLQPAYTRTCTLIGEGTRLRWECPNGRADTSLGRLQMYDRCAGEYKRVRLRGRPEDTYLEELKDFLRCVNEGEEPLVGLREGLETLKVIEAIGTAMQTSSEVDV